MANYFEVNDSSGTVYKIDDTTPRLFLRRIRHLDARDFFEAYNHHLASSDPDDMYTLYRFPAEPGEVLMFLYTSDTGRPITGHFEDGYFWVALFHKISETPRPDAIKCYIFGSPIDKNSNYGLKVYDAFGGIVFDSNQHVFSDIKETINITKSYESPFVEWDTSIDTGITASLTAFNCLSHLSFIGVVGYLSCYPVSNEGTWRLSLREMRTAWMEGNVWWSGFMRAVSGGGGCFISFIDITKYPGEL